MGPAIALTANSNGRPGPVVLPPLGPCRACCAHLSSCRFNIPGPWPSAAPSFSFYAPLQAPESCIKLCRPRVASPAESRSLAELCRAAIGDSLADLQLATRLGVTRQALPPGSCSGPPAAVDNSPARSAGCMPQCVLNRRCKAAERGGTQRQLEGRHRLPPPLLLPPSTAICHVHLCPAGYLQTGI